MAKHSFWTVKVVLLSLQGLLMLFYLGDAHAQSGTTPKVSVSFHHGYLDDVLQQLSEQASVYFVYSPQVLEPRIPSVSITVRQQPLSQVLEMLGQQFHLIFRTEGKYIIVKKANLPKPVIQAVPRPPMVSVRVTRIPENVAPTPSETEPPLTLPSAVRSNALYSSLISSPQQPTFSPVTNSILTSRRPLTWFISGGIFANDFTYGGIELQGGLRRAFVVINAGLLQGSTYRIGYGIGTSLSLHKRWEMQLTYTFSSVQQEDDVKIMGRTWNGSAVRDNSLKINMRHQQVKAMLHYRISSRIDVLFGPTLNFIHTRYTNSTRTEVTPQRTFFVSARGKHSMFSKETAPFPQPGNKPALEHVSVPATLYTENSFTANRFRLGFEVGLSYRINFLRYR